jgi:hypothetical protein
MKTIDQKRGPSTSLFFSHACENSGSWAQPLIDIFVARIEFSNAAHQEENAGECRLKISEKSIA